MTDPCDNKTEYAERLTALETDRENDKNTMEEIKEDVRKIKDNHLHDIRNDIVELGKNFQKELNTMKLTGLKWGITLLTGIVATLITTLITQ